MAGAGDQLARAIRVAIGKDHGRLTALGIPYQMRLFNAQCIHERKGRAGVKIVHRLVIDYGSGTTEIRQIEQQAAKMLGEYIKGFMEGDPRGRTGAIGV